MASTSGSGMETLQMTDMGEKGSGAEGSGATLQTSGSGFADTSEPEALSLKSDTCSISYDGALGRATGAWVELNSCLLAVRKRPENGLFAVVQAAFRQFSRQIPVVSQL